LEEIHHIAKPNIDLHLVYVFENLGGLNFTLNLQRYFWSIHGELLFVMFNKLFAVIEAASKLFKTLEKDTCLDFCYILYEKRNDLSKFINAFPQSKNNSFLKEIENCK
jgi:hypothetical protein